MLTSPQPDAAGWSSIPFPSQGWSSTNPFGAVGTSDCGGDVLVIEDDIQTAQWISGRLQAHGFNVVVALSGEEGLAILNHRAFAIILLDWRLPGCAGIDVLKARRACGDRTPIFVMSGFDALEERIQAFDGGADDFIVKPFVFPEVLARVRARLRRASSGENMQWRIADLVLHVETRRVHRAGREISLTPREFDVLLFLVLNQRNTVPREMLGREVWRVARQTPSLHNAIDVHIAHLRRKIDSGHDVKLIHTVRGEGFVISDAMSADSACSSIAS